MYSLLFLIGSRKQTYLHWADEKLTCRSYWSEWWENERVHEHTANCTESTVLKQTKCFLCLLNEGCHTFHGWRCARGAGLCRSESDSSWIDEFALICCWCWFARFLRRGGGEFTFVRHCWQRFIGLNNSCRGFIEGWNNDRQNRWISRRRILIAGRFAFIWKGWSRRRNGVSCTFDRCWTFIVVSLGRFYQSNRMDEQKKFHRLTD